MSKRNQVQFSRPEDPKFLKLIREQIGYKDEPSVDTKVSSVWIIESNVQYNDLISQTFCEVMICCFTFAASKIESRI